MAIIKGPTQQVKVTLPSRVSGSIGYTGSQGYSGSLGYTGSQGQIGYTGSGGTGNGYTGSQGSTGFTGSLGYTGSAGAGYTGSAGSIGFTGSTGSLGYTGSAGAGYTGSAGSLGYTGSAGADGTIGRDGYTGSQGSTGFTGSLGYTGSAGAGYTGSQGTIGYTGSAGAANTGTITFSGNTISSSVSGNTNITFDPPGTGVIDVSTSKIINVIDPSSDQDAATKAYVDSQLSSINPGDGYTGSQGYTGSKGQLQITTSTTPPGSPDYGDIWIDSATGIQYFYITDGDSDQWVEDSNVGVRGPIGFTGSAGESGTANLGKKFSWSAPADGTPTTGGTTTGTIAGSNATFSNTSIGVVLTDTGASQNGRVVWNLTDIDFTKNLSVDISFYQSGADGISFGIGGTNAFSNSQPYTVTNNSLSFWYKTNTNKTQFYKNGSANGNETDYLAGLTYEDSWVSLKLVLRTISSTRYAFVYHQGVLINSLDITSWSPTGKYIFVGAWSGAAVGSHAVNAVSIDYI